MDRFSFFFAFYGLILGLAVTELLGGFAGFARRRRIRELGWQTGLLALLVFIDICATWIDAWDTLRTVSLNFESLFAPILTATFFYLAAAMAFPTDDDELGDLDTYFANRKSFVALMLIAAELCLTFTFTDRYRYDFVMRPSVVWLWHVPYKLLLLAGLAALATARSRRANVAALAFLLLAFTIPYWTMGAIPAWIHHHVDAPATAIRSPSGSS